MKPAAIHWLRTSVTQPKCERNIDILTGQQNRYWEKLVYTVTYHLEEDQAVYAYSRCID